MKNSPPPRAQLIHAAVLAAAAAAAAGCAPLSNPMATKPAPAVVGAGPSQVSASDRTFLTQAASRVMYEAEVSRLAASRATSPKVRSYARWLVSQRAQVNSELATLMRAKGVPRPAGLPADKATKLQRLAALRPSPDFDQGYLRVVGIEDRMASIAQFEQARRTTRDRDLQAWIDKTLPALRSELAAARELSDSPSG